MINLPSTRHEGLNQVPRHEGKMDEAPEKIFDDLAWLAARACGTPIAVMSLKGDNGQWLKSQVGLTRQEAAQGVAFCEEVSPGGSLYVVPDALLNERMANTMLVSTEPRLRFFAGVALIISDGSTVGTLSVMDRVPRELGPDQAYALEVLARQMVSQLERRP
jgi:GAF domain-containing protein